MTPEQARRAAKFLQHGWPGDFTEEAVAIYLDALMPLPFDQVAAALRSLLLTCRFRPSVAQIREAVAASDGTPGLVDALRQGAEFFEFVSQSQWVNGSGWVPSRPRVHPTVELAVEAMRGVDRFDPRLFERVWRDVTAGWPASRAGSEIEMGGGV